MKVHRLAAICAGTIIISTSANAAGPLSVASILQAGGSGLERIDVPKLGPLSTVSLFSASQSFPAINRIRVPVIGTLPGIPVLGELPAGQGLATLEAIGVFKKPLGR